jgi:hypothetical protein
MDLPDPVPLGVSGTLTSPRAYYESVAARERPAEILADEPSRIAYLVRRLDDALGRPLIHPGSVALVRAMLRLFPEPEVVLAGFAEKALETLRDGALHDRMAVWEGDAPAAVWFNSWNGTHREVQAVRYGAYLNKLLCTASYIRDRLGRLAGFLEIDAFVREDVDPEHPVRPLAKTLEIDVEFSFVPGLLLDYPHEASNPLPNMVLFNRSLCSGEELQALEKFSS